MSQYDEFGQNRVLEPQYVLPTSAWKLDNSRKIEPFEMRIDIHKIHIEGTSFKQICLEANDNDERIKQKIMDIIIKGFFPLKVNPLKSASGMSWFPHTA